MPWRWFYSTEESDTALKATLDASKFSKEYTRNENGLTDGVIEYKVWIEQDSEFELLASKVDAAKIRALASPERVANFGNIRPDNYFDSTKYAAGCSYRDTETLANMIAFLAKFATGKQFAMRDLDIQGSASLGTVVLTLSSLYKKTYNVPVNGTVSDRTLVKAIRDATTPAQVQTNATCNQAMFDYGDPFSSGLLLSAFGTPVAAADWLTCMQDRKISIISTSYCDNATWAFDCGKLVSNVAVYVVQSETVYSAGSGYCTTNWDISSDGISWTQIFTSGNKSVNGTTDWVNYSTTGKTFRYIRTSNGNTGGSVRMKTLIREVLIG